MKFFERYDERSQAIENTGGNRAFRVIWYCLLFVQIVIFQKIQGNPRENEFLELILYLIFFCLALSLGAKYVFCWNKKVDKKLLFAKFWGTVVGSIMLFFMIVIFIFIIRSYF